MYKLTNGGVIRLSDNAIVPENIQNVDWREYLVWLNEGNEPDQADEITSSEIERLEAPITAREYFTAHPAAVDFIRLTPEEQETQIDAMTTAQLKAVVKYLTIAVSALIKQRYL